MIGVNAISIFDSSNVYQFDGKYIESSTDPFTKNQLGKGRSTRFDYTLSFVHSDHETHAQLMDDANLSDMNWRASVAYLDGFLVWDSESWIEVSERSTSDPEASLYPYKITMRRTGNLKIAQARNLVRAWQIAQGNAFFADADSNNIADGWVNSSFGSLSFSTQQSVTWTSGTNKFYLDITFPIRGLKLFAGVNFTTADSDGAIHVEDQDSGATAGNTDTVSLSGTGFEVATITTASDAYKIRLEVRATGTATLAFYQPYVRTKAEYTNS